jgi:hypothetical protein
MGIAIEHGSDNVIEDNDFAANPVGVSLWWNDNTELMGGVYGKKTNTNSERNLISGNRFRGDKVAVALRDTQTTRVVDNWFDRCAEAVRQEGTCEGVVIERNRTEGKDGERSEWSRAYTPPALPGEQEAFLPEGHPRGRAYIVVGEWGPVEPIR